MCGGHHEHHGPHGHHERGEERGWRGSRRAFGPFGRRGFPAPEQWLERLQAYREHLENELKNVQEVIERLGDGESPQQTGLV